MPLYKRGDKEKVENYRGITLLYTAYKIYAEILRKKLKKEIELKGMLPEGQAGFRKGKSTIDNIFILNHLIQRKKRKGEKKIYMFADLKAAFDKVDREMLWKTLKRKGIKTKAVSRIEKIYEETVMAVRTR